MNREEIQASKVQMRRTVAEMLARLTPSRRRAAGIAVAQRLMNLPQVRAARTLMAFVSLPTEIDTWPIIRWAWKEGKQVVIPRIEPAPAGASEPKSRPEMVAVRLPPADVDSLDAHPALRPGMLGILDVPDAPPAPACEIDVVLVPCQAVDRSGNRLGKGGGYFDRFLARPDLRAEAIVLAFHEQVLDEVPVCDGDHPVRMVVTDAEVLVFNQNRSEGAKGE
jgi:5-formyltetrahydrofolate cyclo-ligase